MNKTLLKIGLGLVALAIAFGTGRYLTPAKVVEKQSVKTEVEYITKEVKSPDGTITKEVTRRDIVEKIKDKTIESKKPDYLATVLPKYSFDTKEISYAGSIQKRVLGSVFMGVYIESSRKEIGIPITFEF